MPAGDRVLITVPSRGRPERFEVATWAMWNNADQDGGAGPHRGKYLLSAYIYEDGKPYPNSYYLPDMYVVNDQFNKTPIQCQQELWDRHPDYPLMAFMADDVKCGPDWLKLALEHYAKEFPHREGLLGFNDGIHTNHASHGLISRECLYILNGYPTFCMDYQSLYIDSEMSWRAGQLGIFTYCKAAIVEHVHYSNGKREFDATDGAHQGGNMVKEDKELLDRRNEDWINGGERERAQERLADVRAGKWVYSGV